MTPPLDPPPPPGDVIEEAAPPPLARPDEDERESTRRAKGRVFPCQRCGADLTFDPSAQQLTCPYCGHVQAIAARPGAAVGEQDLAATLERLAQRKQGERVLVTGIHEVSCGACGGTVQFTGTLTATSCAYCANPMTREGVHDAVDRVPVDGVLPFQVVEEQARGNLRGWVKGRWFLPGELKRTGIQASFRGVYLPFFTFDAFTVNRYTGLRGVHYTVTVGSGKSRTTVVRTRWYPAAGSFKRFFDDFLETAGSGLPEKQMGALEPWPLAGLKPFAPDFLSGFLARTYDVPLDRCFKTAKQKIEAAIEADVRQRIGGNVQRVFSIDTSWPALTYKHVLLPVWLASYRWKEKAYRVVVNAATGEVQGERPWSMVKIVLTIALCAALAAGIWYFASQR